VPPVAVKVVEGYAAPVLIEPAGNEAEVLITANLEEPLPFEAHPDRTANTERQRPRPMFFMISL
jgi:hypothetical protein